MEIADGAYEGSRFTENGKTEAPVDPQRAKQFMDIVKKCGKSKEWT